MTKNHNKNNNVCLNLTTSDSRWSGRSKPLFGIRGRIKSAVMLYRVYKRLEEIDWAHLDQIDLSELTPAILYGAKILWSFFC